MQIGVALETPSSSPLAAACRSTPARVCRTDAIAMRRCIGRVAALTNSAKRVRSLAHACTLLAAALTFRAFIATYRHPFGQRRWASDVNVARMHNAIT